MPSFRRRGLRSLLILGSCSALTAGCVGTPPIETTLAALDCAALIPPSYRKPIPPVPRLEVGATVGELGAALDGQTARLDQANGRTADVVQIADACRQRQADVLKALTPRPWWKLWGS